MTLPGSAAPYAAASRAMGMVPAANELTMQFWLKPRTAAAAALRQRGLHPRQLGSSSTT